MVACRSRAVTSQLQRLRERLTTGSGIDVTWSIFGDGAVISLLHSPIFYIVWTQFGTLSVNVHDRSFLCHFWYLIDYFSLFFICLFFVCFFLLLFFKWALVFLLFYTSFLKFCLFEWLFPVSHTLGYFVIIKTLARKALLDSDHTDTELISFSL